MTYLVWELNPRLSVHEADTLPTELTRFLYLPSWVRTDDLQNYSLTLFQLSYWQNQLNTSTSNCGTKNEGLCMRNFKLKRSKTIHHKSYLYSTISNIIYDITLGYFQNHDVTTTGLTLSKGQTRLGKNFESISNNHKTIPLL